jgi:diketogulonate reductase-like aldo/keto reductase
VLKQLYADASVKPAVVQNRFYATTAYDAALREWCAEHGIVYQSFWTLTANPHILSSQTLRALAESYNKTVAQVFFRYLTQIGIAPLTGTCSEQHMREDLDIFDFALTPDELTKTGRLLV